MIQFRLLVVRMTGLEPAQPCDHKILNLARLPIPPHPHATEFILLYNVSNVKDFPMIFLSLYHFID